MPLLRIITGYRREDYRDEIPAILYTGFDGDAARKTSADAPPEFVRIELIESRRGQRLRKVQLPSPPTPAPTAATAVTETPAGAPHAPAGSGGGHRRK